MDAKKVAMVIGVTVLLPLFLGLFIDAVYQTPMYNNYCNDTMYSYPAQPVKAAPTNCTYDSAQDSTCYSDQGIVRYKYDSNGCQIFDKCDFCSKSFNTAEQIYNRNIFFILMPIGLIIVVLGIYLVVDYLGAGLMFAGLITMFYATFRYFSDMSKLLRALVVLIELLIIMWIGYKKIEDNRKLKNLKVRKK